MQKRQSFEIVNNPILACKALVIAIVRYPITFYAFASVTQPAAWRFHDGPIFTPLVPSPVVSDLGAVNLALASMDAFHSSPLRPPPHNSCFAQGGSVQNLIFQDVDLSRRPTAALFSHPVMGALQNGL